jgi:hypothetical protein
VSISGSITDRLSLQGRDLILGCARRDMPSGDVTSLPCRPAQMLIYLSNVIDVLVFESDDLVGNRSSVVYQRTWKYSERSGHL